MEPANQAWVVVIDDDPGECLIWKIAITGRYGKEVKVDTFTNSAEAVRQLSPEIDLMLVDWMMPVMDGKQVIAEARKRGIFNHQIVILSGRKIDELHRVFEFGECLAVMEKGETRQLAALWTLLDEVVRSRHRLAVS